MARLILNCDLGEEEPLDYTKQLLSLVDAANIGCGVHAGSPAKLGETLKLAIQSGVMIGAHPGMPSDGGRGNTLPNPAGFRELLKQQFGQFQEMAASLGTQAAYIKLHGSLYHAVEAHPVLAQVFLEFLQEQPVPLAVFSLANGRFAASAEALGIQVYHEVFIDRNYRADGSLVPRTEPDAVLSESDAITRLLLWRDYGSIQTREGDSIRLKTDTFCVHGDSPDALQMIRKVRLLF